MQDLSPIAVTGGRVAGRREDGLFVFRGMPFAAPVCGRNRWRAPQAVVPWDGVRDASRFGDACYQPAGFPRLMRWKRSTRVMADALTQMAAPQGDDCLNLNIWTPTLDPQAKLPVAVWIHGGSLTMGAGSQPFYDGRAFAEQGIVLVTINYRLGLWGFLGGDDLFGGDLGVANRGFLDQLQALRWVHENIAAFGGDRDGVTVMGESAGGTSTAAMVMSPSTNGLMRRAISFSGATTPVYPHDELSLLARDYLATLGVTDADALAALGVDAVRKAQPGLAGFLRKHKARYGALGEDGFTAFGMATGTALFPHTLEQSIAARLKPDLDLMLGTCRDEARLWTVFMPLPDALASRFMFNLHGSLMNPRGKPAETFGNYRARMLNAAARAVRERAMTDIVFRKGTVALADAHSIASPGRTFLYRFDWASPALGGAFDAIHAIDVPGVFQTYETMRPVLGDIAMARPAGDALHRATAAFIKSGTPQAQGLPHWPAYETQTKPCMVFDANTSLRHDIDKDFAPIW